ncbi:hypothetical protein ACJRPK_00935 [Aquimarina sp. 2-A2]|uniref:hypothetical protein n=1 Tax=Aquimarina sp. 2-A2 TaxID=3382644 RepID=UPI00387EFD34
MKTNFLSIEGAKVLSREGQRFITGGAGVDLSKCGCSCDGSVTGPAYCSQYIGCPQVYTC